MNQRFDTVDRAHKNTFNWLYENSSNGFVKWLSATDSPGIFWVRGKPGAGKSTLMKYAYNHPKLRTTARLSAGNRPLLCCNFFFSGRGTATQQSLIGLLRTALFQVISSIAGIAKEVLPPHMLIDGEVDRGRLSLFQWNETTLMDGFL